MDEHYCLPVLTLFNISALINLIIVCKLKIFYLSELFTTILGDVVAA